MTPHSRNVFLRKSERLKAEIGRLAECLYNTNAKDVELRYENLKTYRVEVQRSFVLYVHLAIEELLRELLSAFLRKWNRRLRKKEVKTAVDGLRSSDLVRWCGRLRLVRPQEYKRLVELNGIRNACVHNWLLETPRFTGKRDGPPPRRLRTATVTYAGKNLLDEKILLHEFCPRYGRIYTRLLGTVWRLQGRI